MEEDLVKAAQVAYQKQSKSLNRKILKRKTLLEKDCDNNLLQQEIAELEKQLANHKAKRKSFVTTYILDGSPAIRSLSLLSSASPPPTITSRTLNSSTSNCTSPPRTSTMDANNNDKPPPMTPAEKKEAFCLKIIEVGEKEAAAATKRAEAQEKSAVAQEKSAEAQNQDALASAKRAENYKFAADIYMSIQDNAIAMANSAAMTADNTSFDTGITSFDSVTTTSFDSSGGPTQVAGTAVPGTTTEATTTGRVAFDIFKPWKFSNQNEYNQSFVDLMGEEGLDPNQHRQFMIQFLVFGLVESAFLEGLLECTDATVVAALNKAIAVAYLDKAADMTPQHLLVGVRGIVEEFVAECRRKVLEMFCIRFDDDGNRTMVKSRIKEVNMTYPGGRLSIDVDVLLEDDSGNFTRELNTTISRLSPL